MIALTSRFQICIEKGGLYTLLFEIECVGKTKKQLCELMAQQEMSAMSLECVSEGGVLGSNQTPQAQPCFEHKVMVFGFSHTFNALALKQQPV